MVDLLDGDEAVAGDPGHPGVDLGDDDLGRLHRRLDDVDGDPQSQVAVPVGGRGLDEGDVDGDRPMAEEGRDLRQKYRGVVGVPPVDGVPAPGPDEEGVEPEVLPKLLLGARGDPQGPDVDHLGAREGVGPLLDVPLQGSDEVLGLAAAGADEDPVAGVNPLEDGGLRPELLRPTLLHRLQF